MINRSRIIVVAASLFALAAAAFALDERVPKDRVPAKAAEALSKLAAPHRISGYEKETEHGVDLYEGEWEVDGREFEAEVTADGYVVEMEEAVAADQVPPGVLAAVKAKAGVSDIMEIEKKTYIMYEVKVKVGQKKQEFLVSAAGQIHEAADDADGDADEKADEADED